MSQHKEQLESFRGLGKLNLNLDDLIECCKNSVLDDHLRCARSL